MKKLNIKLEIDMFT